MYQQHDGFSILDLLTDREADFYMNRATADTLDSAAKQARKRQMHFLRCGGKGRVTNTADRKGPRT